MRTRKQDVPVCRHHTDNSTYLQSVSGHAPVPTDKQLGGTRIVAFRLTSFRFDKDNSIS